jgi:putative transposon-encoded protein
VTTFAGQFNNGVYVQTSPLTVPTSVAVRLVGTTTLATLYTNRTKPGTAVNNPVDTGVAFGAIGLDTHGNLIFFADPGRYDLFINGANTTTITVEPDPADLTTGGTFNGGSVSSDITFAAGTGPIVTDLATGLPVRLTSINGAVGIIGGAASTFQAILHTGAADITVLSPPVSYPYPTTITGVTLESDALTSGATVYRFYVKGPGTSYSLTDTGQTASIAGGSRLNTVTLSIALQANDRLFAKPDSVGATPASLVSAIYTDNPNATPAVRPTAPTITSVSVSGLTGAVAVVWPATAVPSGQTRTSYTLTSSHGEQMSGISPSATTATMTGLTSVSQTVTLTQTTDLGGTSLPSTASSAFTPTTSSQRLTASEQQGQNWTAANNCTISYDSAVTPTGSAAGLVGSLKVIATTGTDAEAQVTRRIPCTASETGKALSGIFINDAGITLTLGIWVDYYDSGGGYQGSSAAMQQAIAAGATATISTTADAPFGNSAVVECAPTVQIIATTGSQQMHVGSVSFG